jgi:hypothetical protein
MFVALPGGPSVPQISRDGLISYLQAAERRSRAGRPHRANISVADAIRADYWDGLRDQRGIANGADPSARALRDQLLWATGQRPLADAVWSGPVADAASSLPEAGTYVDGPPIRQLYRPVRLLEQFPTRGVPVWNDVIRLDYVDHTGEVRWGRGGDTDMPLADYTVDSKWTATPELVWTATEIHYRQEQMAQSPLYGLDPAAEKAAAARTAMEQALETACVVTPAGTNLLSLSNTPCLRGTSALTYGTSAVEACISDMIKWLQTISELSLGLLAPDSVAITQRILNSLYRPVVTSTGYPFDPVALVQSQLAAYGIRRVIIVPSLQDFGGTNVDAAVAFSSDEMGLKRTVAMPFTPVRTEMRGLSTFTYYAAIIGPLYAKYRASTYVYEIPITPVTV